MSVKKTMVCDNANALLSRYQDNELDPAIRAQIDTHLQTCENCQKELLQLIEITTRVKQLPRPGVLSISLHAAAKSLSSRSRNDSTARDSIASTSRARVINSSLFRLSDTAFSEFRGAGWVFAIF